MRRSRPVRWMATVAITAAVWGAPALSAQSIRGHVIDANSSRPVIAASVSAVSGSDTTTVMSDSTGAFTLRLSKGTYTVSAHSLGYRVSESVIELGSVYDQADLLIALASSPIELEGITVVARGTDLRHRASLAGFMERHENAYSVGPSRLVTKDDGLMKAAANLDHVLRWFLPPNGCIEIIVDGRATRLWGDPSFISMVDMAGVEYYRDWRDAPLELKTQNARCTMSANYSIVALWREPRPGQPGWSGR